MITSTTNNQIKQITKLLNKPKLRRETKSFVIEGRRMFIEAPCNMIEKIYMSKSFEEHMTHDIQNKIQTLKELGIGVEIVEDSIYRSISDTVNPQGVLCIARQPNYVLSKLLQQKAPLFILLEGLQDPGNLGTIIRTAEAAGVTAVIMNQSTADIFNPKVVRSTMGAIFRMPFVYVDDLQAVVDTLRDNNVKIYAAHLMDSVDYVTPSYIEGTGFIIGNEGNGITDELCKRADCCVKIPMNGCTESLNASVAAALLMYEAYRQRR